jgi:two-component system nitrate/nitrite sensor histidine kinase NarX
VRKHAHATQVWVKVKQAPQWSVEVCDDGCGFAAEEHAGNQTHVGLRIMHERAERVGATVTVTSARGAGTRVVLTLPEPRRLAAFARQPCPPLPHSNPRASLRACSWWTTTRCFAVG